MDAIGGDYTRPKSKPVATQDANSVKDGDDEREALLPLKKHESEEALLPPPRRGGMSRKSGKAPPRKVQWNDRNGHKLAEVLEFQPSDSSDSDDEESDSCVCTIM